MESAFKQYDVTMETNDAEPNIKEILHDLRPKWTGKPVQIKVVVTTYLSYQKPIKMIEDLLLV